MSEAKRPTDISIAMCTFNGERYLREQLDTISAQSRRAIELVICDDGSTDSTLEILSAYAKTAAFPVRIYRNQVQLRSTRNFDKAIRLCQGEYIALCDQDDRWMPEKLERLAGMLDLDSEAGMVFSDATLIDGASRPTGGMLWDSLRFGQLAQALFRTDPARVLLERPVVTGATVLFRRSLLEYFAQIPQHWVHDGWITWMSVLWTKPLLTSEPLTEYRIHAAQQLGVGKTHFFSRVREIQNSRRAHHASVAEEFEELLEYVRQCSPEMSARWCKNLEATISSLKSRAAAPSSPSKRFLFLISHLGLYRDLAGTNWRSMLKDFFMGRMEPR